MIPEWQPELGGIYGKNTLDEEEHYRIFEILTSVVGEPYQWECFCWHQKTKSGFQEMLKLLITSEDGMTHERVLEVPPLDELSWDDFDVGVRMVAKDMYRAVDLESHMAKTGGLSYEILKKHRRP